jgi:hypothetical protein
LKLKIHGIDIGIWIIAPRLKISLQSVPALSVSDLKKARRVLLYFHGNAGNRATFMRCEFYKVFLILVHG